MKIALKSKELVVRTIFTNRFY